MRSLPHKDYYFRPDRARHLRGEYRYMRHMAIHIRHISWLVLAGAIALELHTPVTPGLPLIIVYVGLQFLVAELTRISGRKHLEAIQLEREHEAKYGGG